MAAEHTSDTVPKTVHSFSEPERKVYELALGANQTEIDALLAIIFTAMQMVKQ